MKLRVVHLALALMVAVADVAYAQPTRLDETQQATGDASERGWIARARRWFTSDDTVPSFTIVFGGIKPGSGAALGPAVGYTFEDGSFVQAQAEISIHKYTLAQARYQSRPFGRLRAVISSRVRWQDAPKVALYELGPDSPVGRALYGERKNEYSARVTFRPTSIVRADIGVGYEQYRVDAGRRDTHEDESLAQVPPLPGLGTRPDFVHTFVAAGIDTRRSGDISRRGSRLNAAAHHFSDRTDADLSFSQYVVEGERLLPIAHERGAVSLAGNFWASTGATVPFFLMPSLGGGDFLRGYRTYRFRDRDAIVLTAQLQWRLREYVDGIVFVDAGSVAPRLSSLSLTAIPLTQGIGVRVRTDTKTIFRMDLARSVEGFQLLIGFSSRASAVF